MKKIVKNKQLMAEIKSINSIDTKIIQLLNQRIKIVKNIFETKQKLGLPICQATKEKDKLDKIMKISSNPNFNKQIFRTIIEESRNFQKELLSKKKRKA